jgi:hypothetical protein
MHFMQMSMSANRSRILAMNLLCVSIQMEAFSVNAKKDLSAMDLLTVQVP